MTRVDVLVVLTLIALLAALIGPRILGRTSAAKPATAPAQSSWK